MIHLDRERYDETGRLIGPDPSWFNRAADERVMADAAGGGAGYEFKREIYGAEIVRAALDALFYGKCGYCEYKLTRAQIDVDHYRPKGRVAEAEDHPGYYWLAYDWTNLIPACIFCNQSRKERAEFPASGKLPVSGKADSFPLVDENIRARSPLDDISLEEPLLLNPTADYPEEHLSFYPDGVVYGETNKGVESINICNLNTRKLYKDRHDTIKRVVDLLIVREKLKFNTPSPCHQSIAETVNAMIDEAKADSAQFAAAARAVVENPLAFGL